MRSIIAIYFFVTALYSCGVAYGKVNTDVKEKIVIMFKNVPDVDNYFYYTTTHWTRNDNHLTIYKDNTRNLIECKPNIMPKNIVETVYDKYALMRILVNHFDFNEILLHKGDSVEIEYKDKFPQIKVLNRICLKYDLGFDALVRKRLHITGYSPYGKYREANKLNGQRILSDKNIRKANNNLTNEERLARINMGVDSVRNSLYGNVYAYLVSEKNILDSIKALNQISELEYRFYKDRNENIKNAINIGAGKISGLEIRKIFENYTAKESNYPEIHHQELLSTVAYIYYTKTADFKDFRDGINKDYRQVFSKIDTSALFPEKDKNYLLTRELNRIHSVFSHDNFIEYFTKYQLSVKDTALVNRTKRNFSLEFDSSRSQTVSMVLTGQKGEKLTFEDLKKRHKGKIIYVDFWASWCGPCREAMPASASLRKELEGKDVVFVYLSIDNNIPPWQIASVKEDLHNLKDNFLVVNHKTSEFFRKYKLNEIPRYMIFDKTGNLIHANAPRVESSEIGLLLTRLAHKP
ncbi:TlpA disulfide reductase family protein [Dyadobacter sp. LHD-138]|uniref:TlpA family protein disulfide reductase n=1 Tax=Dyadobacter sp. LHD-138 TaxID=3071413 RepID=UPI0027E14A8A|nr:TlpA disulfide reductase family protein [Dyadobacter sp. LHD-138]MDQ6481923.1 TlpA disulfide reductase family protein [Dyadobacter sp. LHD-138]